MSLFLKIAISALDIFIALTFLYAIIAGKGSHDKSTYITCIALFVTNVLAMYA